MNEVDAYLDAANLDVTADDIDVLGGEGLSGDIAPADLELRAEDIIDRWEARGCDAGAIPLLRRLFDAADHVPGPSNARCGS